ncbi:MAG: 5'/3'-nucleotidase SurE [Alicyclobacillus sp.]|nr:5'/3'-nucleotidase SurE [Alicyclobacillus sp.]
MRILVCNDDGILAPGIRALAEAAVQLGEVTVVAPDGQRSASSHGISLHRRLYVREHEGFAPGIRAWSVTGTPVDCVKWAVATLGARDPFTLVLSGINEGQNLAVDVLYSGTVAAAGEGALLGMPAVAFSLVGPDYPYTSAARAALRILRCLQRDPLPPDTFLNVNIPSAYPEQAPWAITQLGVRTYREQFRRQQDEEGREYYEYEGAEVEGPEGEETDVAAIRQGKISITPLCYRFTNFSMIDSLKAWLNGMEQ